MVSFIRNFRVFVSSTFADLEEERNSLQRRVWPVLSKLCEKEGFRFQAIDLRWGISEEAGLDQRTSRICLQELKRCQDASPRPNFIILLGNRYGWRPLPEEINAVEFATIESKATELSLPNCSMLREWYRLDENAAPPAYYLRSRQLEGGVDYTRFDVWSSQVELPLRELLATCVGAIPLTESQRVSYERSLTEREILAGALDPAVSDAKEHVFAYFREVEAFNQIESATESEAHELRKFVDFADATNCDMQARQHQRKLKARLEESLAPNHVRKYDASWRDGAVSRGHLDALCENVLADLWSVIKTQIDEKHKATVGNAEQLAHEEFGRQRGEGDRFRGRQDIRSRIAHYLNSPEFPRPLVISGPAGSGKSALMARAAIEASTPGRVVIQRFIGATPPSVDVRSLLQSLCEELGHRFQNDTAVPLEYRELVSAFGGRLAWATAERPILVFLDAVDRLSVTDSGRSLVWLPRQLPPHVRLVVSVLDDPAAVQVETGAKTTATADPLVILRRRAKPEDLLPVEDYPKEDAKSLLAYWLHAEKRTLTSKQTNEVLKAFERCPRPLFLKLAAEEVKQWRSNELDLKLPTAAKPDEMLSAIIEQLFDRLSAPSHHGKLLVERALGYLVASKSGLTEDELLGLLSADREFFDEFIKKTKDVGQPLPLSVESLPVSVWVRLYSDLQHYLTTRRADGTTLLAFYHRSLEQAARKRFLSNPEIAGQRHKQIANYFTPAEPYGFFRLTLDEQRAWAKKLPSEPRPVNIRMIMELPHQLLEAAKLLGKDDAKSPHWDAVANLLLNIQFLEAKAEA